MLIPEINQMESRRCNESTKNCNGIFCSYLSQDGMSLYDQVYIEILLVNNFPHPKKYSV